MGGRGSSSMSGRRKRAPKQIPKLTVPRISEKERFERGVDRINQERYAQVRKMFEGELGFKSAHYLADAVRRGEISMALVGSQARKIKELERKYGAIANSSEGVSGIFKKVDTILSGRTVAAVTHRKDDPRQQYLSFNKKYYGSVGEHMRTAREGEKSGWHTKTDGKITSLATYTAAHEYGHMLANVLTAKGNAGGKTQTSRQFASAAKKSITSIAMKKYGASKGDVVSGYGQKNSAEFFAEAFASAHSGNPNAYGKAMQDWLKKQGF